MNIPDLSPDLRFLRLTARKEDEDFAFDVKRAALGPWIIQMWGWDNGLQHQMHRERFAAKPLYEIRQGAERLGTLSLQLLSDHVRFGEFYLFPAYQGQGTGARVLTHCLTLADGVGLPVRLEYLLWNPVGGLYRRHGFLETGRSEIHCFMERPVGAPG